MLLEKDPLLKKTLSLNKESIDVEKILKEFKKATTLSLTSSIVQQYFCFFKDMPLYAAMDAVAALDEMRWEKNETGYEFIQSFYTGTESSDPLNSLYNREGMKMIH